MVAPYHIVEVIFSKALYFDTWLVAGFTPN